LKSKEPEGSAKEKKKEILKDLKGFGSNLYHQMELGKFPWVEITFSTALNCGSIFSEKGVLSVVLGIFGTSDPSLRWFGRVSSPANL